MPIESLTPNRHFQLVKRILRHIIGIKLVDLPHSNIHIRLMWFAEKQKLYTGEGLEAGKAEERRFEDFDAGALRGREGEGGGGEGFRYCVDAVLRERG